MDSILEFKIVQVNSDVTLVLKKIFFVRFTNVKYYEGRKMSKYEC